MSQTTLLILVDGLRHDYVNAKDAPFLNTLGSLNPSGSIKETFAFQLRPAFLAGLQPEQCGVAHLYMYDPQNSPYCDLPPETNDHDTILLRTRQIERSRGHSASAFYADPFAIPRQLLRYFGFSELLLTSDKDALAPYPTIFDLMQAADKEWLWIAYPTHDQRTEQILAALHTQLKPTHQFVYLHFAELDWAGHQWGPRSDQQRDCLRKIDQALLQVYALANQCFSKVNSIVFGDHGMVPVHHLVDIESLLQGLDLVVEEDYVYFLDSTQARFWFKTDKARPIIRSALSTLSSGTILSETELANLHFRFSDRRFGELIWVVNDEHIIFPNFFQRESPPRGMHGYLPTVSNNWGWLCVTGVKTTEWEKPIEMTRIFPTLTHMLALEGKHTAQEHRTLVEEKHIVIPFDMSVIIPTHNRASILAECLQALDVQSYPHNRMEIIIIDDGSTDNTSEVSARFREKTDITTTYVAIPQSGPSAARNRGIQLAKGHIVLFIGDDIISTPTLVSEHVKHHMASESPFSQAILGTTTWHPQMEITPFMDWLVNGGPQFNYGELEKAERIDFGAFWTSNISLKRDFLKVHGRFNEEFTAAVWEDIELGYRLQQAGMQINYVRDALAYHKHPTTLSHYAHRQRCAGHFAALMLNRCPQLEHDLLQRARFGNPLLVLDEEAIWALVRQVEAESIRTDSAVQKYEAILAWFFAHGFLEGLEELGLPKNAVENSAVDFLLNRVPNDPKSDDAESSPKGKTPVPQGIWTTFGRHIQAQADRIYARVPRPIAVFYMQIRKRILGLLE
jgi:GT2 family glycosyltransferase/predicted AlkP superfamily pyrophosphatase or phosphodiesterase